METKTLGSMLLVWLDAKLAQAKVRKELQCGNRLYAKDTCVCGKLKYLSHNEKGICVVSNCKHNENRKLTSKEFARYVTELYRSKLWSEDYVFRNVVK
jgi:hypothetical protein